MDSAITSNAAWQSATGEGGRLAVRVHVSPPWAENCYLVSSAATQAAVLIDPGADVPGIRAMIAESGAQVRGIFLTHAHYDHIEGLADVAEATGAPVHLHADDLALLRSANTFALMLRRPRIRLYEPSVLLAGGEYFQFADLTVRVFHLPGHTAGAVAYAVGPWLFVGDTVMRRGLGRVDLPGGNAAALQRSLASLLEMADGQTVFYAGHGAPLSRPEVVELANSRATAPEIDARNPES